MNNKERARKIVQMAITDHDAGGWTESGINEIMETHIKSALDEAEERGRESIVLLTSAKEQLMANYVAKKILDAHVRVPRDELTRLKSLVDRTYRLSFKGTNSVSIEASHNLLDALRVLNGWLKEGK